MARPKKTPEIVLSADETIYVADATTMLVAAAATPTKITDATQQAGWRLPALIAVAG